MTIRKISDRIKKEEDGKKFGLADDDDDCELGIGF